VGIPGPGLPSDGFLKTRGSTVGRILSDNGPLLSLDGDWRKKALSGLLDREPMPQPKPYHPPDQRKRRKTVHQNHLCGMGLCDSPTKHQVMGKRKPLHPGYSGGSITQGRCQTWLSVGLTPQASLQRAVIR